MFVANDCAGQGQGQPVHPQRHLGYKTYTLRVFERAVFEVRCYAQIGCECHIPVICHQPLSQERDRAFRGQGECRALSMQAHMRAAFSYVEAEL